MKLKKILERTDIPENLRTELEKFNSENEKKIAELKEANEKALAEVAILKNQNSEKDKFFSIIAHDLRGPLGNFSELCGLLMEDLQVMSIKDLQEAASAMHLSAKKLYQLLENLLIWSKARMGSTKPVVTSMDLDLVVNGVEYLYHEAAEIKGLLVNKQDCNITVECDGYMLETILRNLVGNAIKYCMKGDRIIVSAKQSQHEVEICVADTGIGMTPEIIAGLFRLDSNVQRPGTAGEPSTGLGLLLCKEFVDLHGGKIWAQSNKGFGSSFYFTIPIPISTPASVEKSTASSFQPASSN